MGCTQSREQNPYGYVIRKQGSIPVRKFIISLSRVEFIQSSKQKINQIVRTKLNQKKSDILNEIDLTNLSINTKYQQKINKLQKAHPNAIEKAERNFRTKLDQIMGYNDATRKLKQYRQQSMKQIDRECSLALQSLNQTLQRFQQNQRKLISELKSLDKMSQSQQQKAIKMAKQKNKSQIQLSLQELSEEMQQKFNYENFTKKIQNIISKKKLNEIQDNAMRGFESGEEKINGASDCITC